MSNVWRGYKCYSAEIFLVITQPRVELWGRAGGWRERLNRHETSTAACAMSPSRTDPITSRMRQRAGGGRRSIYTQRDTGIVFSLPSLVQSEITALPR